MNRLQDPMPQSAPNVVTYNYAGFKRSYSRISMETIDARLATLRAAIKVFNAENPNGDQYCARVFWQGPRGKGYSEIAPNGRRYTHSRPATTPRRLATSAKIAIYKTGKYKPEHCNNYSWVDSSGRKRMADNRWRDLHCYV